MKNKITLINLFILSIFFCHLSYAQNYSFEWAKQIGGTAEDYGKAITVDNKGYVYTTGHFEGTVDFDPGLGTIFLNANLRDAFIQKLDKEGNLIWVKQVGGAYNDSGISIAVDDSGYVYTTGTFSGTVDFDSGPGVNNLTAIGDYDIYIQKLDNNGNLVWVKQIGSINHERCIDIGIDKLGNIYATGRFIGTVDFDPNIGTFNLTSIGNFDTFITKLSNNGNLIWVKQIIGTLDNQSTALELDNDGDVYITGKFQGTADFDPSEDTVNYVSNGGSDIFILKLQTNGNFAWVKHMGAEAEDIGHSITLDTFGNIYTTGQFQETVNFNPQGNLTNLTSLGSSDIYIQKLDNNGNFLWVKQIGGEYFEMSNSIVSDLSGNIYTTGRFQGTIDFDPGTNSSNLTSAGYDDIYVLKLDSNGAYKWATQTGGEFYDEGNSIAIDSNNYIYITGEFTSSVDFNPGLDEFILTPSGASDIFIQKLYNSKEPISTIELGYNTKTIVYPNPTSEVLNVLFNHPTEKIEVILTDVYGKLIYNISLENVTNATINLNDHASGVYLLVIKTNKNREQITVVKM